MRDYLDVEEIFGICDTDKYRGSNKAKEKELRDRCRSEARGDHCGRWMYRLGAGRWEVRDTKVRVEIALSYLQLFASKN